MPGVRSPAAGRGELAIVLHTHMPYVLGYGTWPFGEEWLWEAIATSYLPLLGVLDRFHPAPLTLSLTPVLCDQLESPVATGRCLQFLTEIRPESHGRDAKAFESRGEKQLAAEIERSASDYAAAAEHLAALSGGLLPWFARHASWTSAATHPVLPLLASDSGIALQLQTGVASHRRRFGLWEGGMWLPECAYAPWLDARLEEAGVRSTCVELTAQLGLGDERNLRPLRTEAGPVLWPIDREIIALVWSERGYPSHPAYRNHHGLTSNHHRVWANHGGAYELCVARETARSQAREFVARVLARVAHGGLCVFALDTELLGHWWYEGVWWLEAVVEEAREQGLALTRLDETALERHPPLALKTKLPVSSWGEGGDLRTWSGPGVAELAWHARRAELSVMARGTLGERALRELLALQSSDWAFLAHRGSAGEYPRERARDHLRELERALHGQGTGPPAPEWLAPDLAGRP